MGCGFQGWVESVKCYAATDSMQVSFEVQAEICETYCMDFAEYKHQANMLCLNAVFSIADQLVGINNGKKELGHPQSGWPNFTSHKVFKGSSYSSNITGTKLNTFLFVPEGSPTSIS